MTAQEYLVDITVKLPYAMSVEQRSALLSEELMRGRELRAAGVIQRIWRVPGALRNVGIWRAGDATELHEAIRSLPLFHYLEASVLPLAAHPIEHSSDGL